MARPDQKLIDAWIAWAKAPKGSSERDENWWAFDREIDMWNDLEWMWDLILRVLATDHSDQVLMLLSAGPLENLLSRHSDKIIEKVEQEAKTNPLFANLLGGVWQGGMTDDIWRRVQVPAAQTCGRL